ncbi:MAG: NHLP bacteriocin system secretion protein, partial [Longimicrobiaceae bacterium]
MADSIFRKVSLDRLASPEQLDQAMQATTPGGWLALGALALLLVAAIGWGVAGAVPEKIPGQGILVKSGGIFEVVPLEGGRVTDVAVGVGDLVSEGQVIARVAQPDVQDKLTQARNHLDDLRLSQQRTAESATRELSVQSSYAAQQRANLQAGIHANQQTLQLLQQKMDSQERLVRDGLITRQTLLGTRQEYQGVQEQIRQAQSQLKQVDADQLSVRQKSDAELLARRLEVEEAQREVQRLEAELERTSSVVSPYTGRVLEVMAEQGHVVERGRPLVRIDPVGRTVKDLEAVVYVSSDAGKKIRPGMRIQIAPSTVRQEEYGLMVGTVTYVSDFPATPEGMARVLKNDALVQSLAGTGAPYEVHADLVPDPRTVSHYRWTSPAGPPV